MKITIEETPKCKWIFDITKIEDKEFKKEIEYHTNQILKSVKKKSIFYESEK